ncbi:MAG: S-layer homology domain-containing protein [Oscillospiraceae bacterium]|nr:S-layer homology domain-containing protein [Oscillospiraceae bacterium]
MKRIFSAVMCLLLLAVLCTALAGSAGTASDPLVSLSYIDDTFTPAVLKSGRESVSSALGTTYAAAVGALNGSVITAPDGFEATDGPKVLTVKNGGSVTLASGSSVTLLAGTASLKVGSGAVVDVTNGKTLASGAAVPAGVRLLCDVDTTAVLTAPAGCTASVSGYYKTTEGTAPQPKPQISFTDVPEGAYYAEAVRWAVARGITNGVSETEFAPESVCTRGQIVTFLYRAFGEPETEGNSPFTDVPENAYYAKAVRWAVARGITNGVGATEFAPDQSCTRGQTVTFLYRSGIS